jgi:hypothetical protein
MELAALWVLEALLAASYRPTVYRHVAPPPFLGRCSEVLDVFDPFDFHGPDLSPRQARPVCLTDLVQCVTPHSVTASY